MATGYRTVAFNTGMALTEMPEADVYWRPEGRLLTAYEAAVKSYSS